LIYTKAYFSQPWELSKANKTKALSLSYPIQRKEKEIPQVSNKWGLAETSKETYAMTIERTRSDELMRLAIE
jgi:hypothetical protein